MTHYLTYHGVYENGLIRLVNKITKLKNKSEITVLIPVEDSIGIKIKDFVKKGNICSIGGDSVIETEEYYND